MNRKITTIEQLNITNYFYAVYPLSLEFKQNCQNLLYLEFEKNLQIMFRYQLNKKPAVKGQVIHFQLPAAINHFRILSQKNLQYQWSLYSNKKINEQDREQFIESHKINYRQYWNDYKSKRTDKHIIFVQLNKIKCRIEYIFVIAHNTHQLLAKIKNHFVNNKKAPLPYVPMGGNQNQKFTASNQISSKLSVITDIQVQSKNIGTIKKQQSLPWLKINSLQQSITQKPPLNETEVNITPQLLDLKMGNFHQSITQEDPRTSNIQIDLESPQKKILSVEQKQSRQLKLSHSEIMLSNQIANEVQQLQSSTQKKSDIKKLAQVQLFHIQQAQDQTFGSQPYTNKNYNLEPIPFKKQEAEISMTSSMLLNDKRQPIIPIYKKKTTIMIIIMILLILGTGLGLYFIKKSGDASIKSEEITKKPAKQKKKKQKVVKKAQKIKKL